MSKLLPKHVLLCAMCGIAPVGVMVESTDAFAQEPAVSIQILKGATPVSYQSTVGPAIQSESPANMPAQTQDAAAPSDPTRNSKRGPIEIPPLTTPNLNIDEIGTKKLPDDFVAGRLPPVQALPYGPDREYALSLYQKTWTAPVFCHQPLYYEDTMLERHGHERFPKLTPMLSGVRFYTGIFTTPYLAYLHRPLEDRPNTGHYRPGSAAPGVRERAPYDPGALRFQLLTTGGTIVGLQP